MADPLVDAEEPVEQVEPLVMDAPLVGVSHSVPELEEPDIDDPLAVVASEESQVFIPLVLAVVEEPRVLTSYAP